MDRRELIKMVSLATGSVLSAPLLSSILVSCKDDIPKNEEDYILQFFNKEDFSLVKKLIDVILPKTDSPSATEVGVHQMIDLMIGTVYKPKDSVNYSKHFAALKNYLDSSSESHIKTLGKLSNSNNEKNKSARKAFMDLKQQTVAYYLSTENIATNYLNYLPIPGKYEACISLDEVGGKAWAL